MNCFKCKNPLDPGVRFCGSCGAEQPGAVIPQAAVRTNQKTLFQGSTAPVVAPPEKAKPNPTGPRKVEQVGFAATMAPGTGALPVSIPTPVQPQKALSPEAAKVAVSQTMVATPIDAALVDALAGDLTGKTLNNRYLIEGKLGEGGFGSVYRARQTQMNRQVALKVLHPRMAKDPQVVGRFKREAQASSLLRAQHTVQVYDFDQTPEGVMYLSMEMLQGKSLHSVMADGGALDPVRVARVLDGIAESLDEAHAQGIVHRDIKPENIFLEPRPTPDFVKVLDFGIAKIVSGDGLGSQPALTAAGQTLGTLEYMSPEQLMGKQLDGRSDLYALGILGYEMLTGELPFSSKTPGEIITFHLKTLPPAPSGKNSRVPPLLDAIVARLAQKSRDDRYKDTAELRADLAKVLSGQADAPPPRASAVQPAVQRSPSTRQPTQTEAVPAASGKISPTLLAIGIGLLIGVAAVLVALFLRKH
jgi:serine/threonine-protein kinase